MRSFWWANVKSNPRPDDQWSLVGQAKPKAQIINNFWILGLDIDLKSYYTTYRFKGTLLQRKEVVIYMRVVLIISTD